MTLSMQTSLDLLDSRDRATFERRVYAAADALGFPLASAILVLQQPTSPDKFITVSNPPAGYQDLAASPEWSRGDPVITRLKRVSHPFTYDQSMYVREGQGERWETQAACGYRTGIAMASHLAHGQHFLFGVDRDDPLPTDPQALWRLVADLQAFASFAQEAAVRLLTPAGESHTLPKLSPREMDVLRWSSDGKSSEDVGQILNITARTVNFHVINICKKLGVARKDSAVAKAVRLGLLH